MQILKIHRIHIEKFRRIQEPLDLDLTTPRGDPVEQMVLAGPNGCGKTSVLEGVLLALGQEGLILRATAPDPLGGGGNWRVSLPPEALVEVEASLDGGPTARWGFRNGQHFSPPMGTPGSVAFAMEYFSSWRAPAQVGPVHPLDGGRRPADTEINRLWRLKQRIADDRARSGFGSASGGVSKADEWLRRLNAAWARFHGDDGTRIDAQIVQTDAVELRADLLVLDSSGRPICSVDQASSGEIELLSFAGLLILNDFKGGLLVIDEPELHLHPQWQATFLPALRELAPAAQFLVATHSDAVWDQTPGSARFLLVPENDSRSTTWRESHVVVSGEGHH